MKKELGYLAIGAVIAGTLTSGLVYAQSNTNNGNRNFDSNMSQRGQGDHMKMMFNRHGGQVDWMADHAEIVDMTIDELQAALDAGQRFHEIAEDRGITQEQMHEYMQPIMQERIAELVANGTITQEQADLRLEHMEEREMNSGEFGQHKMKRGFGQGNR
ncbi:DUF3071 domain-containing protein [bacterium]|jgi:hypothetical protein|nr:DUF3071 domain-containing protein [bacterium]MBT4649146.1 DUF3071 domain-containing protein [bacterium]